MLSANQVAGFLNFDISETIGDMKLGFFCMQVIKATNWWRGFRWVWSGMPKEAIKTLRPQKLKEV